MKFCPTWTISVCIHNQNIDYLLWKLNMCWNIYVILGSILKILSLVYHGCGGQVIRENIKNSVDCCFCWCTFLFSIQKYRKHRNSVTFRQLILGILSSLNSSSTKPWKWYKNWGRCRTPRQYFRVAGYATTHPWSCIGLRHILHGKSNTKQAHQDPSFHESLRGVEGCNGSC